VDVWNVDVALFFKAMVDTTIKELAARRRTRTDADLEATARRMGMSEQELQFERDKIKEDGQLDTLGRLMENLHQQAMDMGTELGIQKGIIDHLDSRVDATDDRLKKSQKGLDKLLSQPSPAIKK